MSGDLAPAETRRRTWARIAEAAAMHHRLIAGPDSTYGDPDLKRTSEAVARGSLLRAVQQAQAAGVEQEEIVDAICSADHTFDRVEAHEYVVAAPQHEGLSDAFLRDLFGERD